MSKPWKPGRETVALPSEPRPSRIRRDPARIGATAVKPPPSREREMWAAVAGVAVIAAGCAALVVGISQVTSSGKAEAVASEAAPRFSHCRTNAASDCVLDGDTIFIAGQRVEIAGVDAPDVHGSRCPEESRRGIQAAVRLRDLLNRGTVAITASERAADGRIARRVEADGRDVALTLVAGGFARTPGAGPRSWC